MSIAARFFRNYFFLIYFILTASLLANYEFLGSIQRYQIQPQGITLYCESDVQVQIRFLQPNLFRLMVIRPGFVEPPLNYPLVQNQWEEVALNVEDKGDRLLLQTTELQLYISKAPCRLKTMNQEGEVVNEDDPAMGMGWDGKEVRVWKTIATDEKFFCLGEKTGDVNRRGREYVMWNSDIPGYSNETDPLYQSIPFFIGIRNYKAYGIYLNNSYRSVFNMGAGNKRYYSIAADQGLLDYFFIYGPKISRVVQTYTQLTGRMPLPPKWALGYQQSRWSYFPQAEVLRLARTFREKQIPADVIYLDIHYMDAYRVFTWDRQRFPDPAEMLKQLGKMGFKVVVIVDPGVKVDSNYRVAREGLAGKHFVRYPDGEIFIGDVWPGASYFPDFSQQATRIWWGGLLGELVQLGIKGIWNDMNEPAVWGRAFPLEVIFDDNGNNSSQKKMHNLYGFLMSQAAYEAQKQFRPAERPFVLTRAGFAGIQRYSAVWTGDNVASWEHLALGIRMMLGLGLSGVPFVGTDVGGFIGTPSKELFARWMQVGAFSPFFRNHTEYNSNAQEPWAFGEQVEEISKKFISLRYRFLPYLYSVFWESSESGAPVMRPLFWNYQSDRIVYAREFQHQFMVGENLLVAPVLGENQSLQKVYLPAGQWLEFSTGTVYQGNAVIRAEAPLDQLPIFLKQGAIVPTREPVQYVDQKPISRLQVEVFPATKYGNFLFYEDDGRSFDYLNGTYRLTEFEFTREGKTIVLYTNKIQNRYLPPTRSIMIRMHALSESPRRVRLGKQQLTKSGGKQGWDYFPDKHLLKIWFPETDESRRIKVEF